MLFFLKNTWVAYQIRMDEIFEEEIGETLEVYMDDMIVKSIKEEQHDKHLANVF